MSTIAEIDNILNPRLNQVVGSTPESLKESILKLDFKNKRDVGARFAAMAFFAASVNKKTLEELYMSEAMGQVRVTIAREMTINNTVNMTAISLAGHCLLTVDDFSSVKYVSEFRKKMGQNSLWDGEFGSGSISEKQKEIYKQKKGLFDKERAKAFADWYCQYTGLRGVPKSLSKPTPAPTPADTSASGSAPEVVDTTQDTIDDVFNGLTDEEMEAYFKPDGVNEAKVIENLKKHSAANIVRGIRRTLASGSSSSTVGAK